MTKRKRARILFDDGSILVFTFNALETSFSGVYYVFYGAPGLICRYASRAYFPILRVKTLDVWTESR